MLIWFLPPLLVLSALIKLNFYETRLRYVINCLFSQFYLLFLFYNTVFRVTTAYEKWSINFFEAADWFTIYSDENSRKITCFESWVESWLFLLFYNETISVLWLSVFSCSHITLQCIRHPLDGWDVVNDSIWQIVEFLKRSTHASKTTNGFEIMKAYTILSKLY